MTFWDWLFSLSIWSPWDQSKLLCVSIVYSFLLLSSIPWYGCIILCLTIHILWDNLVFYYPLGWRSGKMSVCAWPPYHWAPVGSSVSPDSPLGLLWQHLSREWGGGASSMLSRVQAPLMVSTNTMLTDGEGLVTDCSLLAFSDITQ